MTDQPKTALEQFLATAERVNAILGQFGDISNARALPGQALRVAEMVDIRPYHHDDRNKGVLSQANIAREIQKTLADRNRGAAERERDARLCALAAELTAIRSALPNLAARAAIELGVTSRALFAEAQEGSSA